jgi:hypothetical protein
MERTILVTGGDKAYFLMGCMLVHSLKKWAPRLPVYFLDFGLERAQRKFLDSICTVLRQPNDLAQGRHQHYYKGAMGEYARSVSWTTLIWLDSDMIAVGPVGEGIKRVLRQMESERSEAAASIDSCGTIGNFIASGLPMAPFVEAVEANGIARSDPYFNTGFVACRSQAFLDAWFEITASFPEHTVFEQNAFNVIVRKRSLPTVLAANEWNVHGKLLPAKAAALGDSLVLHATSTEPGAITLNESVLFGPQRIESSLKLFSDPALQKFQEQVLMDFMRTSHRELQRLGLLV